MAHFSLQNVILCAFIFFLTTNVSAMEPSIPCRQAYRQCIFRFEGPDFVRQFFLGDKFDFAFTPRIMMRSMPNFQTPLIGILNSNGREVEIINDDGVVVPISKAIRASPRFSPTHFKTYTIKGMRGSGIGHQALHGNQKIVLRNRCIRVYFSEYQLLKSRFPSLVVSENVKSMMNMSHCIVFFTKM